MLSGQIDIQMADGTIHSFGPNDLRLWEDVTGEGHKTRFPVPSVTMDIYSHVLPGLQEAAALAIDKQIGIGDSP